MAGEHPFAQLIYASTVSSARATSMAPSSHMSRKRASPPRETSCEGAHMTHPSSTHSTATGSARRCGFPECAKTAKPGGLCISHGGGKKCSVEGCTTSVVSRGCCVAHGGGKRCQRPECTKSAQTGGFCWIHGGGKKCGFQGCVKRAQSGGACISHGGGKRCRIPECNKVVQYDGLCVGHGGYRKCLSMNCAKKALANSYCATHGGNSQCAIEACIRKATKGRFCSEHKGGVVVTPPVQQHGATFNETTARSSGRSSIEPTTTKQQQNAYLYQQPQQRPSSSPHHHQFEHRGENDLLQVTSWHVGTPHMRQQLPSYAFAKDRPSLHMDATSESSASRSRHGLSSFTPPLPSLTSRNLLPAIGGIQARLTPPHAATPSTSMLGKRTSPQAEDSPQPIKRLASLASLVQRSRPSSPAMRGVMLKPLTPQHALPRKYSPGNLSSNHLFPSTRHAQVDPICQRHVQTDSRDLERDYDHHHASYQHYQSSSLRDHERSPTINNAAAVRII
uniref:WRKY19-like zinc finger domain-containing protein n=1 Tax=Globisporangium ultimum (strain ATCC 200006 / CBS 805.95 / DAOM BR144) TaxID=431595 RepID=K3WJ46_GLOUD